MDQRLAQQIWKWEQKELFSFRKTAKKTENKKECIFLGGLKENLPLEQKGW